MAVDLTKLIMHSSYPGFKNNNIFPGSFTISGSASVGLNTRTATIDLDFTPDMADVLFNGPAAFGGISDPRPASGWFSHGYVYIRGDSLFYQNYPTPWHLSAEIIGSTIVITARCRLEFDEALTLTSTTIRWRLVDYSVF